MLKKTFLGVLFAVFVSGLLIAGINFNVTKAVDYGSSGTSVCGIIWENTTWTLENSPYVVVGHILVETNVTLTIEPGVVVKFDVKYYLMIKGKLNAIGSSSFPITFTSNATMPSLGDWDGIRTSGSNANISFSYCTIQYATTGISSYDGNLTLSNSKVQYNNVGISFVNVYQYTLGKINCNLVRMNGKGIEVTLAHGEAGGKLEIENNTLLSNHIGIKIYLGGYNLNLTIARNVVSLNTGSGLMLEGIFWPLQYFVNITLNYITFNGLGIHCILGNSMGRLIIKENDIHGNTEYDFQLGKLGPAHPSYDQNATLNYWGTTNTTLIDKQIYDFYDDYRLGKVQYVPIVDHPLESRYPELAIDRAGPIVNTPLHQPEIPLVDEEVRVLVNVRDAGSGIHQVILSHSLNDGITWANVTMSYNLTTRLYEGVVPGQLVDTTVKYRIIAYDYAENVAVNDNNGQYYVYTVIPEFPSILILAILMVLSIFVMILTRKRRPKIYARAADRRNSFSTIYSSETYSLILLLIEPFSLLSRSVISASRASSGKSLAQSS